MNPTYHINRTRDLLDEYGPSRERSLAATKLDEFELCLARCEPTDEAASRDQAEAEAEAEAEVATDRPQVPDLMANLQASLMKASLTRLVGHETEPCRFDHHGICQEHSASDPPCSVAEARGLLGLDGSV